MSSTKLGHEGFVLGFVDVNQVLGFWIGATGDIILEGFKRSNAKGLYALQLGM